MLDRLVMREMLTSFAQELREKLLAFELRGMLKRQAANKAFIQPKVPAALSVDHAGRSSHSTESKARVRFAAGSWGSSMVAGSPGVGGMSNSSSSSGASWRSGTPSPPLFEEGVPSRNSPCPATAHPSNNQAHYAYNAPGTPGSTPGGTPIITLDEGIVPDYIEEQHPRKKVSNLFCSFTSAIARRFAVDSSVALRSILHEQRDDSCVVR